MAKVSFYLFEKSPERQVESACRLCRKILRKEAKIWLLCEDSELQQQLDELLWRFDATSFLPHSIEQSAIPQSNAPICISSHLPSSAEWIVFNFNNQALEQAAQFSHIIEISRCCRHWVSLSRRLFSIRGFMRFGTGQNIGCSMRPWRKPKPC